MSGEITVPTFEELVELRETGRTVGYNGIYIYLRYKAILEVLRGRIVKRVLNIGCGFGIFDRLLPDEVELLGLDLGEAEIEFASAYAAKERPSFTYHRQRLEDAELEPGSFDLVILSEVLEHMPEPEVARTIDQALAALRPRGLLLVTLPSRDTLRNRARRLFRREPVLMDRTHLREYSLQEARELLLPWCLEELRFEPAVLYFPKEQRIAKLLPPESPFRQTILQRFPMVASHFIMLYRKP